MFERLLIKDWSVRDRKTKEMLVRRKENMREQVKDEIMYREEV